MEVTHSSSTNYAYKTCFDIMASFSPEVKRYRLEDGGSYFLTEDAHFINSQPNKHYTSIPFVKDGYTIRNTNLWNSGIVNVGSFVFSFLFYFNR